MLLPAAAGRKDRLSTFGAAHGSASASSVLQSRPRRTMGPPPQTAAYNSARFA